jgi:hypothetical protein
VAPEVHGDQFPGCGGKAFDSNTGFAIGPQQRIFSPDASWVSQPRIDALTPAEGAGFWPLSPDVIIEVKSDTDAFDDTVTKIALFIERGSGYAVAIDPETREVVELGTITDGLGLDFDAIIDAQTISGAERLTRSSSPRL